jgi:hypothetical protein
VKFNALQAVAGAWMFAVVVTRIRSLASGTGEDPPRAPAVKALWALLAKV